MSYSNEQRAKHKELVEKEMSEYTTRQRGDVLAEFIRTWPDTIEAREIIKQHKETIALEATPEELDTVIGGIRI